VSDLNFEDNLPLLTSSDAASSPDEVVFAQPRQPHLGYAIAFAAIAFLLVQVFLILSLVGGETLHVLPKHAGSHLHDFPMLSIFAMLLGYGGTFGVSFLVFPRLWERSFKDVLEWNASAAKLHLRSLMGLGVVLCIAAESLQRFLPIPKSMPMDDYFRTPSNAWVMMFFGTLVAPAFEELLFRGFLLRAFAIAWDWIRLPKTPEAQLLWRTTESLSRSGIIFASILTSFGFALMHAAQLAHAWSSVAVLFGVGLTLTWVRLHYRSLAASTLVHATYNGFIFTLMCAYTGGFQHLERMQR
jgi:uncharacterized protein